MMSCHGGGSKPVARRCAVAWVSARSAGMLDSCSNASKRSATAGARSWMAGSASLRDAQQAACRCSAAERGPRPPSRWEGVLGRRRGGSGVASPVIRFARQVRIAVSWVSAKGCARPVAAGRCYARSRCIRARAKHTVGRLTAGMSKLAV